MSLNAGKSWHVHNRRNVIARAQNEQKDKAKAVAARERLKEFIDANLDADTDRPDIIDELYCNETARMAQSGAGMKAINDEALAAIVETDADRPVLSADGLQVQTADNIVDFAEADVRFRPFLPFDPLYQLEKRNRYQM